MKKHILTLLILAFSVSASWAQYNHAVGLRAGLVNGITYKKMLSSANAFEIVVDPFVNGFELSGIYEWQKGNAFGAPGLAWYLGLGASVGAYNGTRYGRFFDDRSKSSAIGLGALGIIGLEYAFSEIPIALSLDGGIGINFAPYGYLYPATGLGIKYYW